MSAEPVFRIHEIGQGVRSVRVYAVDGDVTVEIPHLMRGSFCLTADEAESLIVALCGVIHDAAVQSDIEVSRA